MADWGFRPIRETDLPLILDWYQDEGFRFRSVAPNLLGEQQIRSLTQVPEVFLIEREGLPAGLAFLEVLDPTAGRAKVDLRLAGGHCPEGVVKAWVSLAFAHLGLRRLIATCASFDEPAAGGLLAAGFRLEGRLHDLLFHQGRYWDELHFALLRDEWEGGEPR